MSRTLVAGQVIAFLAEIPHSYPMGKTTPLAESNRLAVVRLKNLNLLLEEFRKCEPGKGSIKRFADKVAAKVATLSSMSETNNISANYITLLRTKRKTIGDVWARRFEAAFNKPEGWLDKEHTDLDPRSMDERFFIEAALSLYRSGPEARDELYNTILDLVKKKGR